MADCKKHIVIKRLRYGNKITRVSLLHRDSESHYDEKDKLKDDKIMDNYAKTDLFAYISSLAKHY